MRRVIARIGLRTRLPARAAGPRALSTSAPAPGAAEHAEHLRRLSDNIHKNVAQGVEAMKSQFGGEHAEKRWMVDYYRHREHKFLVPAAMEALNDDTVVSMPSLASKTAFFFAHALRTVPAEFVTPYVSTFPFILHDQGLLLAVMKLSGMPQTKELLDRVYMSIRKKGDRELLEVAQHVGSVPAQPVETWALPFESERLQADWQQIVQPFEIAPIWRRAKDVVSYQQYLLLASTTLLDCLWAAFHATGDKVYVRRVFDIAQHWGEFAHAVPDQVQYLTNITSELPKELTADATTPEAQRRSVKAQISRAACWSILTNARRHEAVTEVLGESIGALAPLILDSSAVKLVPAAAAAGLDTADADAEDAGAAAVRAPSPAEVALRLEVFPALAHLLGHMVLDSRTQGPPQH